MVTNETMLPCTKKTRKLVQSVGYKGETWDQLLQRITNFYIDEHMKASTRRMKA